MIQRGINDFIERYVVPFPTVITSKLAKRFLLSTQPCIQTHTSLLVNPMTVTTLPIRVLILSFLLGTTAVFASEYTNILGSELQSCSSEGMALTGYTRTGFCVDQQDDSGSHHICVDLSSTTTASSSGNFCDVTGQSDWCSSEMPCHEDQSKNCPVQSWCVCQW